MLTLDQVRAVNDGLKSGDLHAALRPLEETIDLRHAELPRLEKSALTALKTGLQTPENAQMWAEAAFHPNISVRRFVRKTMLGLKRDAAPFALPLQKRLEQFWAEETPLSQSIKPREAALRREQQEIVQSAVEMLLRADPETFIAFYKRVIDAQTPEQDQNAWWAAWHTRQSAYSKAVQEKNNEIIRAEWGEEYLGWEKRSQIPWRIWREIDERVQSDPEVQKLRADLGESPWERASQQWNPLQFFQMALNDIGQFDASGPKREIGMILRPHFWAWIEAAFANDLSEPEKTQVVRRAQQAVHRWGVWEQLGKEEFWARIPGLLQDSKAALQQEILTQLHDASLSNSLGALWIRLANCLAGSCQKPYSLKEEWIVASNITPELLRSLKVESKEGYLNQQLESTAKYLEKERDKTKIKATQPAPQERKSQPVVQIADDNSNLATDWSDFEKGNVELGIDEDGNYVALKINADSPNEAPKTIEETLEVRAARLIDATSSAGKPISRLQLWRNYKNRMGEDAKKLLWPLVAPALWKRYEEKLEEYRRVEIEEPSPVIENKLTDKEMKQWKTDQRRLKRQTILNELHDIASLLREAEGVAAAERLSQLLKRPGVKEVATNNDMALLQEMGSIGFYDHRMAQRQGRDANWLRENFFIERNWEPLIARMEEQVLVDKKSDQWQRRYQMSLLAVAYYRLNNEQSRTKFRELLSQIDTAPHGLAGPVVALGDVEAWLLLIEKTRWQDGTLKELWTRTRQTPDSDEARHLTARVLELVSRTAHERGAKLLLEMLNEVPVPELETHAEAIISALESPIISVKRWALKILPQLLTDYDQSSAGTLASEMLWHENSALVKDAAKFLGAQERDAISIAWDALQDATSLENQAVLEAIFRALTNLKKSDKTLQLNENAQEKLNALCEVVPDRFEKFAKKLGGK